MFASFKTPEGDDVFVVVSKVLAVGKSGENAVVIADGGAEFEVKGTPRATRNAIIRAGQPQPADAPETEAPNAAE